MLESEAQPVGPCLHRRSKGRRDGHPNLSGTKDSGSGASSVRSLFFFAGKQALVFVSS